MALYTLMFCAMLPFIVRYLVLWGVTVAFTMLPMIVIDRLGFHYHSWTLLLCLAAAFVVCCIIIKKFNAPPVAKAVYVLISPPLCFIAIIVCICYNAYAGLGTDGGLAGFWQYLLSLDYNEIWF